MNKIKGCIALLLTLKTSLSWSINPLPPVSVSNSFLFIENNIDSEYFISSYSVDPRFSGSNKWGKYGSQQVSLGYMGVFNASLGAIYRHADIWIDDSPINSPFTGLRCTKGNNCPQAGHIPGAFNDKYGFYRANSIGQGFDGGNYGFAALSTSAYEYFRSMTTGSSKTFMFNYCRTSIDYSPERGERCKDQHLGIWDKYNFSVKKNAHLSLNKKNITQDLWVASDGTPSVGRDSSYCILGSVNRHNGVICKVLNYNLTTADERSFRYLYVQLAVNPSAGSILSDFIKFSGDGTKWHNYNSITTRFSDVFSESGKYVYVFMSQSFLKQYSQNAGTVLDLFTFRFNNRPLLESGFYEFTPSIRISIIPKDYSISILSSGHTDSASGTGTIGSSTPIELSYTVTVSGPRQADSVIAQVTGKNTIINTIPYCLFTSAQGAFSVPVPALLQYTNQSGHINRVRSGCQGESVSLKKALWKKVPWDANSYDGGSFYSTDLKLLFPMNDPRSELTDSGNEWQGVVSASGEIKVSAKWLGVDR